MRGSFVVCLMVALLLAGVQAVEAGLVKKSFDFELEVWHEIGETDGPITLHRVRLTRTSGGLRSALARSLNKEYLENVAVQLEFSNSGDEKWKSRISVRWLDGDGKPIDGLTDNEGLNRRTSRGVVERTIMTSKYGLEKAESLEVEVFYEP